MSQPQNDLQLPRDRGCGNDGGFKSHPRIGHLLIHVAEVVGVEAICHSDSNYLRVLIVEEECSIQPVGIIKIASSLQPLATKRRDHVSPSDHGSGYRSKRSGGRVLQDETHQPDVPHSVHVGVMSEEEWVPKRMVRVAHLCEHVVVVAHPEVDSSMGLAFEGATHRAFVHLRITRTERDGQKCRLVTVCGAVDDDTAEMRLVGNPGLLETWEVVHHTGRKQLAVSGVDHELVTRRELAQMQSSMTMFCVAMVCCARMLH